MDWKPILSWLPVLICGGGFLIQWGMNRAYMKTIFKRIERLEKRVDDNERDGQAKDDKILDELRTIGDRLSWIEGKMGKGAS